MKFLCESFLSISHSGNGALYPVYRRLGGNVPYVQEVDRHGHISAFIEATDIENYKIYHIDQAWTRQLSDHAIFGFRWEGVTRVFEREALRDAIRCNLIDLGGQEIPLLTKVALARVSGLSSSDLLSAVSNFVNSVKGAGLKRNAILRAERGLLQSQPDWWDRIYECEFGQSEDVAAAENKNNDDIISWLYNNNVSNDWKRIFAVVLKKFLFDERIADLLTKFLLSEDNVAEFDDLSKSILGRVIESYLFLGDANNDFEDLIVDRILDGSLFYIASIVSHRVLSDFLRRIISSREESGDDSMIIESLIDVLESDVVIPRVVNVIVEVIFGFEMNFAYGENSAYAGQRRITRLINIFHNNPAVNLYLRDGQLRNVLENASPD